MGLSVVMAVLAFAFYTVVRDQNLKAHAIHFSLTAQSLAESGANYALDALRHELQEPTSATSLAIQAAGPSGLGAVPMPDGWEAGLQEFCTGIGSASISVSLAVVDVAPLASPVDPGQGYDAGEKTATLVVTSRGTYRTARQSVIDRRTLRVVHLALPVVSRFSLFLRSPDPTDETAAGYNAFWNDISGAPDPTVPDEDNVRPLVVYNHGEELGTPEAPADNGWCFLGGDREVVMNLTSGGDYRYGQYFHFYNFLALDTSRPAAFINDSPPPFFTQPHSWAGQEQQFELKHAFYGYFTIDQDLAAPGDMNRDGLLRLYFQGRTNMCSSTLHLYGSSLRPSPTKVYGRVYHSYPIYSAATVDVNGDGARDGIVKMLPAVPEEEYPNLDLTDPIPTEIPMLSNPSQMISLDPDSMHYSTMFGDYAAYEQYMSILIDHEAYNTGADYLRSEGEFPPQAHAFDAARDYPNPGTEITIPACEGSVPHFQGDLNRVEGAGFARKAIVVLRDQAEFKQLFIDPSNQLRLDAVVRLEQGDLSLPENLRVLTGGTVLVPGNIAFDRVTTPDDQIFTLCSTAKDLHGAFSGPVDASLVALHGQLRSSVKSRPLEVKGTLALDRLSPTELPAGGKLTYDQRLNPSLPGWKSFYRVYVADRAAEWSL